MSEDAKKLEEEAWDKPPRFSEVFSFVRQTNIFWAKIFSLISSLSVSLVFDNMAYLPYFFLIAHCIYDTYKGRYKPQKFEHMSDETIAPLKITRDDLSSYIVRAYRLRLFYIFAGVGVMCYYIFAKNVPVQRCFETFSFTTPYFYMFYRLIFGVFLPGGVPYYFRPSNDDVKVKRFEVPNVPTIQSSQQIDWGATSALNGGLSGISTYIYRSR